jgi:hypothetical protein
LTTRPDTCLPLKYLLNLIATCAGYSIPTQKEELIFLIFLIALLEVIMLMTIINLFGGSHWVLCYIDPGTGSLILQIILGGFAGLWMILKLFGDRIKQFFGIKSKDEKEE